MTSKKPDAHRGAGDVLVRPVMQQKDAGIGGGGLIAQSLNLTCAVELVLDSGRFCLEVVIPPANDPISFRGIFFFYKDGENHILDDEALDRLMQRDMSAPYFGAYCAGK